MMLKLVKVVLLLFLQSISLGSTCSSLFTPTLTVQSVLLSRAKASEYYKSVDSLKDYDPSALAPFEGEVKVISNPQEGILSKLLMIRRAQHTIDIGTYIMKNDLAGKMIMDELKDAIKRGISVRIMIDASGSMTLNNGLLQTLQSVKPGFIRNPDGSLSSQLAKVEVAVFNPVFSISNTLKFWFNKFTGREETLYGSNKRSHDKILLIDGEWKEKAMAIIGGRNISESYYAMTEDASTAYEDMEVLVKNSPSVDSTNQVGSLVGSYFEKLFFHLGNKYLGRSLISLLTKKENPYFVKSQTARDEALQDKTILGQKLSLMINQNYLDQGFVRSSVRFLHEIENFYRDVDYSSTSMTEDPALPNENSISAWLRDAILHAKTSIDLVSPYVYFTEADIKFLHHWIEKDPTRTIRIVTNSVMSGDNIPAQVLLDQHTIPLLIGTDGKSTHGNRIKIYTYGKPDAFVSGKKYGKIHGKYIVIDEKTVGIGTYNGDPRSRLLNSECGFTFKDAEGVAASEVIANINRLVNGSTIWGSPEWQEVRSNPKYNFISNFQKYLYKFIQTFHLLKFI